MDAEEISYKTLRKIQQAERQSPVLTQIEHQFYKDVSFFIKGLHTRLEGETQAQKKMLLHEELQNIEKIARNIYEHREKKIILAAISKARGGNPSLKNMIQVEIQFFDEIYRLILSARSSIFEQKTSTSKVTKSTEHDDTTKSSPSKTIKKEQKNSEKETKTLPSTSTPQTNPDPIIRITEDIPTFIGTDKQTYNLKKADVLSISPDMADMLVKRKAAQLIMGDNKEN
jgi:DNA replication initiation complex subunit (GINS family)